MRFLWKSVLLKKKKTTPRIEATRSDRRCNSRIIRISNNKKFIYMFTFTLKVSNKHPLISCSSFATVFALSPWIIKSLHWVAWDTYSCPRKSWYITGS